MIIPTERFYRLITIGCLLAMLTACGGGDDGGGGGDGGNNTDTTPPTVTVNTPVNGATDIVVGFAPTVTFSEAMDAATINDTSFTMIDGGNIPVGGTVSYDAGTNTATFTPFNDFDHNDTLTATISTAVTDSAGNPLAANHSWSFTTVAADNTPPTVSLPSPTDGTVDVVIGVTPSATFSEAMNAATITDTSFTLVDAGMTAVAGAVSYNSGTNTATFTPTAALANNTSYTATITTAVTDVAGNPMAADYSWSFTTEAGVSTAPTVSTTNPLHRARGALLTGPVTATFDEALDPATVNTNSFVVSDAGGPIDGTVSLSPDGLTASFTPTVPFSYSTRYDVQLTTEISDIAGNQLDADHTWFFNSDKRIASGLNHVCARTGDDGGSLKCWGQNGDGQLGLGDTNNRGDDETIDTIPTVDLGTGRRVVQVVAGGTTGYSHTCARLDDNSVKCWGGNNYGQLGLGDDFPRGDGPNEMGDNLPTVNLGASRVAIELAAGGQHTCARLDNNRVKCWGRNDVGQLGQGDTSTRGIFPGQMGGNLPAIDLGTDRRARGLKAGHLHTCAKLDDGNMKCWGANTFGQLGLGDINSRGDQPNEMGDNLPALNFGGGHTAEGIVAGGQHTCARLDDSSVKCWGRNHVGQLGLGDTNNRGDDETIATIPTVDLGSGYSAAGLALGSIHSCVRLNDSSMKCWGANGDGQLGQEDRVRRGDEANEMGDFLPVIDLGSGLTVITMEHGSGHSCAHLSDDNVKCWGLNSLGQLGQGDTDNRGDDINEMGDDLLAIDIGN